MDPNSYEAYMVGQAGPDNLYRSGPTPSKYVKHLTKIGPVGRFGGVVAPAISLSNPAVSPYDNPYTATTRPAAGPSIGTNARLKTPPLATGQGASTLKNTIIRSDLPSLTTTAAVPDPSVASNTRTVNPTLSNGSGSIPSPPSQFPARSPSPDAEALISSLENYQTLSDDALYDASLAAQQAMVKWQNEYMALENEISRMKGSPYHFKNPKAKPRKLVDPEEYDRKHHASLYQSTSNIIRTMGQSPQNTAIPLTTNPINNPPPQGRSTRNELHIDMTAPMQPLQGKRIRKPRLIDNDIPALPAPKKPTKRAREPDSNDAGNAPAPPAKKQYKQSRDISPPAWVRTRDIKTENNEPSAPPENESRELSAAPLENVSLKRESAEMGSAKTGEETKEMTKEKEKDPVRAEAARLMWAKRKASGTNGRYGGKPTERTVAKAMKEGGL